jgi:hypothetical protein
LRATLLLFRAIAVPPKQQLEESHVGLPRACQSDFDSSVHASDPVTETFRDRSEGPKEIKFWIVSAEMRDFATLEKTIQFQI